MLSALVAFFSQSEYFLRAPLVIGFLFLCPGLVLVRFLEIQDRFIELTLAIALSIAMNVVISEMMVFVNWWLPHAALFVLLYLTMAIALYDLLRNLSRLTSQATK